MALNGIAANTMLQLQAPDRLRGRVMGFYSFVVLGMAPLGSLQAGWLAERFGVRVAVASGGVGVPGGGRSGGVGDVAHARGGAGGAGGRAGGRSDGRTVRTGLGTVGREQAGSDGTEGGGRSRGRGPAGQESERG